MASTPATTEQVKGGTLVERYVAYFGTFLLALLAVWMFSTAVDPQFGLGSPMWLSGFLPLVGLIAAVRQLRSWNEGSSASRLLDPIRSRFGLRALPTLAWLSAGGLSMVGLYALLNLVGVLTPDVGITGTDDRVFLYGAFFAAMGLDLGLSWSSDRRDRLAKEAAGEELIPPSAPGRKTLMAAQELPAGMRKTASVLQWLTIVGVLVGVVFLVIPQTISMVWFIATLIPFAAWIGYSYLVLRPRLREIEREQASRVAPDEDRTN
jgi:hypothetical protein